MALTASLLLFWSSGLTPLTGVCPTLQVTDVDVTTVGLMIGMLAVFGAAQQQILIQRVQKKLGATSNQVCPCSCWAQLHCSPLNGRVVLEISVWQCVVDSGVWPSD